MIFATPYNLGQKVISWSIVIIMAFIIGFLLINLGRQSQKSSPSMAKIRSLYGFFLIAWGIGRILFILSDITLDKEGESVLYAQYTILGYLVIIWAFILLIYTIEKYSKENPNLLLTKISLIGGVGLIPMWIISIFSPNINNIARYFAYSIGFIVGSFVFFYYIWFAFKVTGVVRKRTLFNLVSIALIFAGHTMDARIFQIYFAQIIWVPP
ncbi:MAG: hypothetical protein ACTSXF_07245, partial [Promethearchaeota archaeon]